MFCKGPFCMWYLKILCRDDVIFVLNLLKSSRDVGEGEGVSGGGMSRIDLFHQVLDFLREFYHFTSFIDCKIVA